MHEPFEHQRIAAIAACEMHIARLERELELLAWLPTAHFFTVLERLNCERAQMQHVLRAGCGAANDAEER